MIEWYVSNCFNYHYFIFNVCFVCYNVCLIFSDDYSFGFCDCFVCFNDCFVCISSCSVFSMIILYVSMIVLFVFTIKNSCKTKLCKICIGIGREETITAYATVPMTPLSDNNYRNTFWVILTVKW